jgi:pimeloyl-ACP methyl ester carboxylesterase
MISDLMCSMRTTVRILSVTWGLLLLGSSSVALAAPPAQRTPVGKDEALDQKLADVDIARIWSTPGNRKLTIILPPYGADQNFFNASRLPGYLSARGIDFAVLFTETTGYNQPVDIVRLDALISHLVATHRYDPNKVVLGGFSAGGYGAFRYALRKLQGEPLAILPAALISVDAPLDIERWWRGMNLFVQRSDDKNPFHGEAQYLTQMYRELLGGTPDERPQAYREHSILTASVPDGGNAVWFKHMPMRLYSEPDMDFFVPYGLDYGGINASDQVSLAAIEKTQGNDDVSLVLTSGRGYRADLGNRRLPHSWSIVDESELAGWISARLAR